MNRQSGTVIWLLATTLAVLLGGPASAENDGQGQIIVMRDVQPRTATRPPLAPDPNPRIVKTSPEAYVDIGNAVTAGELSDSDFAHVNSGMAASMHILTGRSGPLQQNGASNQRITRATSGIGGKAGGGGGATGGIAGTVNRGVQQGLRPLTQALPGQ
jgi:hypothetical protein